MKLPDFNNMTREEALDFFVKQGMGESKSFLRLAAWIAESIAFQNIGMELRRISYQNGEPFVQGLITDSARRVSRQRKPRTRKGRKN